MSIPYTGPLKRGMTYYTADGQRWTVRGRMIPGNYIGDMRIERGETEEEYLKGYCQDLSDMRKRGMVFLENPVTLKRGKEKIIFAY